MMWKDWALSVIFLIHCLKACGIFFLVSKQFIISGLGSFKDVVELSLLFFLLIIIHTSERPYILVEWSFQTRKNSQYLLVGDHAKITLIIKKIVLCVQYVKFNFLPILILSGIEEKQNETPHVPSHGSDLYHLDKVLISWSQSPVSFLLLEERFMLSFP